MTKYFGFLFMFTFSCSLLNTGKESAKWKYDSAKLAREYAYSLGDLYPEFISEIGFSDFDAKATPFGYDLEQQRFILAYRWSEKLKRLLKNELDPELETDIKILLANTELEMESIELAREQGVVSFIPLAEFVFSNLKPLLEEGVNKKKNLDALKRLKIYSRGTSNSLPIGDGITASILKSIDDLEEKKIKGVWPKAREILNYFEGSSQYFVELEKLLAIFSEKEWKDDLENLKLQEKNYQSFVKKILLPRASRENKIPQKLYGFLLKNYGVFDLPEKLIRIAESDYKKTYGDFVKLGNRIAKENNLPLNRPVEVVSFLLSKAPKTDEKLMRVYSDSADKLLRIVKENDLLSLRKKTNFLIRFGTKAEMHSVPAPHFRPPPLLENTHKKGQYIIPRISGAEGMKDFSYPAAIVNLTAHEAIPGHALQYQVMKERGSTLIRAKFAFNSANVEGWAHYAEEIVYPYLSHEEKFITLQRRLWRQARMFLDPQLNLGIISREKVFDVFEKELGFSRALAESEYKRYAFIMPGQATSYYYGRKILTTLKKEVHGKLGQSFTEKCFNDALVDFGVLPLKEIAERLKRDLSCP